MRGITRITAVLAAAVLAAVPSGAATLDRPAAAGGPRVARAPDAAGALQAARTQGSRVEAVNLRTETRTVYAQPNGTMTAEVTARPVRVKQPDGSWAGVDTTLVRRPDGTVGPRSAAVDLSFSGGGGTAPLVRYGKPGKWIELTWPGRLPAPTLAGDTATYSEVMPGVDLKLTADVNGYAQYLIVKDRAAAANPAVRAVRLGLRSGGVSVRATAGGGLEARDAKGAVLFTAPVSQMWDAGSPRRQAVVGVAVEKGALVLRPDRALLADPAARFPVTVDPVWHTADKQSWTSVLSGKATTPYPNSSGSPPWAQVGRCYEDGTCNGIGEAWTYWLFDTSFLAGRLLISADLHLTTVYSPSCGDRTHQLYLANAAITSATTWNTRPSGSLIANFTAPSVYSGCAGNKEVGLSVAGAVNLGGTTTYLVKASDSNDQLAWRKYDNNAKLTVNFNQVPNVPTNLATDPPMSACHWCAGYPFVGDDNVRLMATLTDPDGDQVQPIWHVEMGGVVSETRGAFLGSGQVHSFNVGTDGHDGQIVEWAVKAEDGAHGGGWAHGSTFLVDRIAPAAKPNVRGVLYQADNRWHGGVGVPGRFVFDSAGVTDIDHFLWGWTQDPTNLVLAGALGGSATVDLIPPGDGPRDLFVQSVDRAGHRSPTQQYHFYVRAGSGPLAQYALDGNAEDDAFLGDRDGTALGGVTYAPGAVGQAARLDGVGAYVTAPPAVRTDASFSVSAWAKLDSTQYTRAVVSQSGTAFAGFDLWYRPENGGHWAFGMAKSDASYQGTDLATSAQPAQAGVWTHLTGVYDASTRKLQLYVNGVLAGTADRTVPDWNAGGWVQIGRTLWNGAVADPWHGLVDEVKIYDRVLSADEVRAAVGADDVQVGQWKFDELSGTTGRNAVDGGEMVALRGDAAFTGDSDGDKIADGGAVGGALKLDGNGDYAATTGPVLHTNQSFTVSAWVRLDQEPPANQSFTALSQDGTGISGFFLGYRDRPAGDVWEFALPGADVAGGSGGVAVQSSTLAQRGVPTHLAAVYDADAHQIRLYVNGALAGSTSRLDGFDASGPFVIGRGFNGGLANHWNGWVDEVRAYSRALSTAEIQAVVSADNVALGQWHLDGSEPGATLNGTPAWTAGQTDASDPTDLALQLSGDDHLGLPLGVNVEQSFAVAAWAKLDKVGGTAAVMSQDGPSNSAFQLLAIPDGRWSFAMSGGSVQNRVDGPAAQAGVWTHLVGIYDAGAHQLSLYVNGVQAGVATSYTQTGNTGGKLQIGAGLSNGTRQNRFIGAIDDVAVYGRTLFAAEIRTMAGRDLTLAHNWRLDEASGAQAPDAVGQRAATLTGGVTRVPGRLGNAISLNGTDGRVSTSGVDIRTDANFTVAAWVRMEKTCDIPADEFECKVVAVSLDGTAGTGTSKFRLGNWRDRDQHAAGTWVFEMPEQDGTITKAAVPVLPSDFKTWVHLSGVYDKAAGKLVLYVNGTRKGDGTLSQPWQATGGLQIGRARDAAGNPGQYFPGLVDDVRIYSGLLDNNRISNLYNSYPAACGTTANPTPCTLPAASAGRWRFDENASTTAVDSSGRGLTATLGGGASWVPGRMGYAAGLDGTSGYVQTAGPVLNTAGSFSVSAWVYAGATSITSNQVVLAQSGSQSGAFYLYYDTSGRWAAATTAQDAAASSIVSVLSSERVSPGNWTQLGLVYDASLHQLRLYVNGRLSAAQTGAAAWSATGPLTIGRGRWAGADSLYFKGAVDDVRAFGTALRDGEMSKVYDDSTPVMTGNWTFDNQTVADSSSRSNPTTATGAASFVDGVNSKALALDGKSAATAQSPAVNPLGSLTVSAWVKLTYEPAVQTVLAQDGSRMSTFALQYRPDMDTWVFGAWTQDADDGEFVYARSRVPAALGEWMHLTGVYDHAAGELRLYVNGQLAGSREGITLSPATGGLSIGRGQVFGAPAQFFTGQIDEVRADIGIVPDNEIAQRATRA